jgi:hypothetical protein
MYALLHLRRSLVEQMKKTSRYTSSVTMWPTMLKRRQHNIKTGSVLDLRVEKTCRLTGATSDGTFLSLCIDVKAFLTSMDTNSVGFRSLGQVNAAGLFRWVVFRPKHPAQVTRGSCFKLYPPW